MNGPSDNLSWKELACKDGTPYPAEWRNDRAIQLANAFEIIRKKCGNRPIKVLSAYRTHKWNLKIGGAPLSKHLEGKALDLKPPKGMTLDEFHNAIVSVVPYTKIRGIGKYGTFIHIDIRTSNRLIHWAGNGLKDSVT